MEIMALYGGKLGCVAALRKKREILVWLDIWVCLRDSQVPGGFSVFNSFSYFGQSRDVHGTFTNLQAIIFFFYYFIADSLHATKLQKIN